MDFENESEIELGVDIEVEVEPRDTDRVEIDSTLSELAHSLERKLDDYKSRRTSIENRWLRSMSMYYGTDGHDFSSDDPYAIKHSGMENTRRRPRVNIVRSKCRLAITKLEELTFGKNSKDYKIEPTPSPELVEDANNNTPLIDEATGAVMAGPDGTSPVTVSDLAPSVLVEAQSRAEKMARIIDDQLIEGDYAKEAKKAQKDYVILGTGIIKGPILNARRKMRYKLSGETGRFEAIKQVEIDTLPVFRRVDPWLFFPDPDASSIQDAEDAFELIPMNRKQFSALMDHPLFIKEAVMEAIELGPSTTSDSSQTSRLSLFDDQQRLKNKFHVWAYYGPVNKENLKLLGNELGEVEENEDIVMAEVWFCNGRIIRLTPSLIEGDMEIPYAVDTWEEDESSVFGISLPETLADHQRVAQKTWEMILDNSGLSVGPQVVINKAAIRPANGKWEIEPLKIWYMTEYGEKAGDAMKFFDIPSNSQNLQAIHSMARAFADEESATPLAQQAAASAQTTSSATGIAMMFNTSNILQKADSRSWGENITAVVVRRLYHYNMQDDSIPIDAKGDYEVKVTPSANIIGEQLETQDLERLAMMAAQEPFSMYVNHEELFRAAVNQMHIDGEKFLKPREQVAQEMAALQEQQQQPDPALLKVQVEQERLRIDEMKVKSDAERRAFEVKERVRLREEELRIRMYEAQERQQQALAMVLNAQRNQEIALMKLAEQKNKTIAQLKAELGIKEMEQETKRFIALINSDLDEASLSLKELALKQKLKDSEGD